MTTVLARSRLWLLSCACAGLLVLGPVGAAFSAEPPKDQPPAAADKALPDDPVDPADKAAPDELEEAEIDKEKVLDDMYERLRAAPDAESAEVVADAIEKLWLRSGSDTVDLLMGRALQLVQEERYDVALKLLDAVVVIDPNYSEGWNQRATVNFLKQDYRSSLDDLRHVLSLDPRHFKAISGLALILQELGDKPAALKAFRKALAVHPYLDGAKQAVRELSREVEGQGI